MVAVGESLKVAATVHIAVKPQTSSPTLPNPVFCILTVYPKTAKAYARPKSSGRV